MDVFTCFWASALPPPLLFESHVLSLCWRAKLNSFDKFWVHTLFFVVCTLLWLQRDVALPERKRASLNASDLRQNFETKTLRFHRTTERPKAGFSEPDLPNELLVAQTPGV